MDKKKLLLNILQWMEKVDPPGKYADYIEILQDEYMSLNHIVYSIRRILDVWLMTEKHRGNRNLIEEIINHRKLLLFLYE